MFFFFQAEDGIRDYKVTGVQTCALPISLLEELALVEPVAPHDVTEARGVGEGDRDDPVAGARGAGELVALGRHDLDIERQAPEVTESEAPERGPPAHEEVLVDGIGEEAVGRGGRVGRLAARLAAAVASAERVGPGTVMGEPAESAGTFERLERLEPGGGLDERPVGEEEKRGEGRGLRQDGALQSAIATDPAPALHASDRAESWRRVPPEEQGRVLEGEREVRRGPPPRPRGRRRSRPDPPGRDPCRRR